MIRPIRLQLSRARGFDLEALSRAANGLPAVTVARPTRWGNLWSVGRAECACDSTETCEHNLFRCETAFDAVETYRAWLRSSLDHPVARTRLNIAALHGKNLACWCGPDEPCHADVLLEFANAVPAGASTKIVALSPVARPVRHRSPKQQDGSRAAR
jgi:hypothetical protein